MISSLYYTSTTLKFLNFRYSHSFPLNNQKCKINAITSYSNFNKIKSSSNNELSTANKKDKVDEELFELFKMDDGWSAELINEYSDNDSDEEIIFENNLSNYEIIDRLERNPLISELPEHQLKKIKQDQIEANDINNAKKEKKIGKQAKGKRLKIISGTYAGIKLYCIGGYSVRPMMERVRGAIFNMILGKSGNMGKFSNNTKWLDLYAGTGSVGLEAISRGCSESHFIELDPNVISVLTTNIKLCKCQDKTITRRMSVEDYLDKARKFPSFSKGPFDYVSVCPPYLAVSYPELQDLLASSGVLHENSVMFMEYPKQFSNQIKNEIGPLKRIKDRRYGRTYLAIYA